MKIKWKNIKGYEGIYQISNTGMVRSLDRYSSSGHKLYGKTMKQQVNDNFMRVSLCNFGVYSHRYVHILVAKHFVDNPKNYRVVRHKTGNLFDNNSDNLYWIEYTDYIKKTMGIQPRKPLKMYDLNNKELASFKSISDAVRYLKEKYNINANITAISHACNGRIKTAYKFKWKRTYE